MDQVRVGIIGVGSQGSNHLRWIRDGQVPHLRLAAVCDVDPLKCQKAQEAAGEGVQAFESADALFESGCVDAVIISTPHYMHPILGEKALKAGLHVMVEKPSGVYARTVRQLNETAAKSGKVFGMMFNQRTNYVYAQLKALVANGELGALKRVNWIVTDWYRSQYYYDEGDWRATWAGEGGGVLLNQNPHNLDLFQWIFGMPKSVFAICENGKFHDIEAEDDVTALVKFENGATGVYVTSTGDIPGTNRLEVSGDKGKAVVENNVLRFWQLDVPESEFRLASRDFFAVPHNEMVEYRSDEQPKAHVGILNNWAEAILQGKPLLAPGQEGIRSLEISNAIQLSAWKNQWVDLPVDDSVFEEELNKRIAISRYKRGKGFEGC